MGEVQKITQIETPYSSAQIQNILNPLLKKWFFSRFKEFSLPQLYGVMEIHKREHILISAPTGATKTLTGFLSILNELVDSAQKQILQDKVYCVYISPLKALNNDILKNLIEPLQEIEKIAGKNLGIRVAVRTGDTTSAQKQHMLKHPPHILITTPESLSILLSSIKFINHLKQVDWCIVDEIHALAENKRGVHLSLSLERLSNLSQHLCRVGLSATVAPLEEVAKFLVGSQRDCKIADIQFLKQFDFQVLCPVKNLIDTPHQKMHDAMYELIDNLIQQHKTTLIFTNTRSATERVVDHLKDKFPKNYANNIGAHHGSLGKRLRQDIEERLRKGELKCVVCSTSLELGLDIGFIDLVICLGSPKSVARFLQRAGRAGHKLHEKVKGRIIVMDRDDLVECAVLMKSAIEKKIDKLHIPTNCLDVLAQQLDGMALEQVWEEKALFKTVKQSYCYKDLSLSDFNELLDYLAGKFADLEDRHIYAKIWRKDGMIGKRGKMGRVIYMTNIGTIPDESFITVKVGDQTIGQLDEAFLERLHPGDVFVLGGETYLFKFSRGMVAQVVASANRPPTVPSWASEMLPLSFDLALEICRFRRLMLERFVNKQNKGEILKFINEHVYVNENAAQAIYEYFKEQFDYAQTIPHDKLILVEHYSDPKDKKIIFHTLFGRRVNDCLSRAVAYVISRTSHKDVEIGINDNGFYISGDAAFKAIDALKILKSDKIELIMKQAIENSEVLKRRFRHCATRSLMILRNYMGREKHVGRQQVSSMILMSALKRISVDFSVLKEARREVLEDLMDIKNTKKVIELIQDGTIKIQDLSTSIPTPFAFNISMQGYLDILKIEDKHEFLQRMHQMVLAKISLNEGKIKDQQAISYDDFWEKTAKENKQNKDSKINELKNMALNLKHFPGYAKQELIRLIDGDKNIRDDVIKEINDKRKEIEKDWPKELSEFVFKKIKEIY